MAIGTRGPLPKPTSLRSMKGGGMSRRSLADIPADELGTAKMPSYLSADARKFWRRHAPELEARGLLTALDETSFALVCDAWAQLRQLDARIEADGHMIVGPRGGMRVHPLTGIRNKVHRSLIEGMKTFGMTPASRARIQVTPPRTESDDPFDAFLTRRDSLIDNPRDPRHVLSENGPA